MAAGVFVASLLALVPHSVSGHVRHSVPPVHVALGFGVDTARSPQREIFALYGSYLAHLDDASRPNPFWSEAEQQRWQVFDLVRGYVYQGFTSFTVVHLAPAVGLDSTYLIRALVSSVGDSTRDVKPLALYRLYAIREAGRWVLANALPRLTRTWHRETIKSVTFVYPPGRRFARQRAEASVAFVDSLARAFELSPPATIDYYFTDDLIDTFRAMGLDFFPIGSDTVGGRADAVNGQVFVGSSTNGEGYRHELAHVVLQPLVGRGRTAAAILEGLMTWTGGSAALDFGHLVPGLKAYVQAHPQLTLEAALTTPPPREGTLDVLYDGAAVLCAMVYEKGRVAGIRELVSAGPHLDDALRTAARLLGVRREDLDRLWRDRVLTY
jgi:hypothetical protein